MDELKWELLTEVQGRWEADVIKAYLAAYGVDSEIFQEAAGQLFPTSLDILGRVQIFVARKDARMANKLLDKYLNPPKANKKTGKATGARRVARKSGSKILDSKKSKRKSG